MRRNGRGGMDRIPGVDKSKMVGCRPDTFRARRPSPPLIRIFFREPQTLSMRTRIGVWRPGTMRRRRPSSFPGENPGINAIRTKILSGRHIRYQRPYEYNPSHANKRTQLLKNKWKKLFPW
jgi:hypothetical protein